MNQMTILADLAGPSSIGVDRKTKTFILSAKHAKVFIVDEATTIKLFGLVEEHRDLYESQRQFAKPPFDCTYVEFNMSGSSRSGVVRNGNMAIQVADLSDGKYRISKSFIRVEDAGLRAIERTGLTPHEEEKIAAVQFVGLSEVLWLLMHRPGVVKVQQVPSKQKVIRGKLRPMRAYSTLTIDLATKDIARTILGDGRKGSGVREHEVRGTWVHLQHIRSCEHQWAKVDRAPYEPDTFQCPCCGTKRVWRKDHVRGEHSRGNKFNTYLVKDSRLETRH